MLDGVDGDVVVEDVVLVTEDLVLLALVIKLVWLFDELFVWVVFIVLFTHVVVIVWAPPFLVEMVSFVVGGVGKVVTRGALTMRLPLI